MSDILSRGCQIAIVRNMRRLLFSAVSPLFLLIALTATALTGCGSDTEETGTPTSPTPDTAKYPLPPRPTPPFHLRGLTVSGFHVRTQPHQSFPLLVLSLILFVGCTSQTTYRRVVDYPGQGVARQGPEGLRVSRSAIRWENDPKKAIAKASRLRRPVFVYVGTVWCGPCKRLKATTFKDKGFAQLVNERTIALSLDAEKGPGKAFARRYKITSYPTLMFLKSDGTEIDRAFGYRSAPQMARLATDMLAGRGTVADLQRRLAARPDAIPLRFRIAQHLAMRGDVVQAVEMLEDIVRRDPKNAKGFASRAMLVLARHVHRSKRRDNAAAAIVYRSLLKRFPRSGQARTAAVDLATLLTQQKDRAAALVILEKMVSAAPNYFARKLDGAAAVLRLRLDTRPAVP